MSVDAAGSGFGAKKACASPVHLLYAYPSSSMQEKRIPTDGDGAVWAVNSLYTPSASGLVAEATQYDLGGAVVHTQSQTFASRLAPDSARRLFDLNLYPKSPDASTQKRTWGEEVVYLKLKVNNDEKKNARLQKTMRIE